MLSQDIKQFIEENIDLIQNFKFDLLYQKAIGILEPGQVTDVLLAADINPLDYLDTIPPLYFDGSKQTSFVVPKHIKAARVSSFSFSNIEHVELHKDCELLKHCFHSSSLKSVIIPYIMNEVPEGCFYSCRKLTDVDLNAIEQIDYEAFALCKSLRKIFIPDNITHIDSTAFVGCDKLVFLIHDNNEYAMKYAENHNIKVEFI